MSSYGLGYIFYTYVSKHSNTFLLKIYKYVLQLRKYYMQLNKKCNNNK